MSFKLTHLVSLKGDLNRGHYVLYGLILFFLKFNLDRLISLYYTQSSWSFLNYLMNFEAHTILLLSDKEKEFYLTLAIVALPFIWMGTALTIKRLRSAGLPLAFVVCFFIPFVNLLAFAVLSILPEKENHTTTEEKKPAFLKRIIPEKKWGSAAFAVFSTLVISLILLVFAIHVLENYAWGVFIGVPFLLGFNSALLFGYHTKRTLKECLAVAHAALVLISILIFVLAIEGIICLIMAFPIGLLLVSIGATLGYSIQSKRNENWPSITTLIIMVPLLMSFESKEAPKLSIYSVSSSIHINATPSHVWKNVVKFPPLPEPEELLFKAGIAYPISAEITGNGKGAIRCCVFNTGKFIEPIEIWDENSLLQFSVSEQPQPMIELTPYKHIDAPHLNGYFASTKGQFLLKAQSDGTTVLEGTTWYYTRIWPGAYWKLWSDYILHTIHSRVLKHIKKETEMNSHKYEDD
jgi:uncharacterized membrane protein YhaH (DUF805 family)